MNFHRKQYLIIMFMTALIINRPITLFAEKIKTTVGFKSAYSYGISDTNIAYKPFVRMAYDINFFKIEATGMYTIHQQITDGMGNFTEINTGQGQVKTLLTIGEVMELGGGYSIAKGENSYNSKMYMLSGSIYIGDATIDLDYNKEDKQYNYNLDVNIINYTFIGSLSYDINDLIGCELEYHYLSNNFSNLDYTYDKKIVRMGMSVYTDQTIYMAGINAGTDSGDYTIFGADFGLSKKVYTTIKIMIAYNIDYYNPPSVTSITGGGHGGSNGGGYKGANPYLRSDMAGKSFFAHSLSASLSYSF
ncbi:MAG: hypothetical protein WHV26_11210 [Spirochaetota bacterium]